MRTSRVTASTIRSATTCRCIRRPATQAFPPPSPLRSVSHTHEAFSDPVAAKPKRPRRARCADLPGPGHRIAAPGLAKREGRADRQPDRGQRRPSHARVLFWATQFRGRYPCRGGVAVARSSRPANIRAVAEILATAGMAGLGVVLGYAWAGSTAVIAMTVAGLGFAAAVLAAYTFTATLIPVIGPVVALAIAGGSARAWRGVADRRDRRALRALFSRFVSEPVVDQIMKERDLFMSGGRPRPQELTATVLYADVAGFTTICEGLAPEPLIGGSTATSTQCRA